MNRSLFLLLIFLTGCVETQTVAIGPPPTHDQSIALVQEYVHKAFVDPHSIQDLTVEPPVQQGGRWVIFSVPTLKIVWAATLAFNEASCCSIKTIRSIGTRNSWRWCAKTIKCRCEMGLKVNL